MVNAINFDENGLKSVVIEINFRSNRFLLNID